MTRYQVVAAASFMGLVTAVAVTVIGSWYLWGWFIRLQVGDCP